MDNLRIDGDRLWTSLMEMARIGATEKGGVCRLALTDADRQARDLFVDWAKRAGCTITIDAIGNIFARRQGKDASLPAVMAGSHLDSQPTGGRFDGAYGVLAGLEAVRSLNDLGIQTNAPIDVVAWTNEEGARFAPAMMGSGVFAGAFDLDAMRERRDLDGRSVGEELQRIGYAGRTPGARQPVSAYFEVHIEQGPILEEEGIPVGVVTGAQGIHWYDVHLTGMESHAGTTPMAKRKDALVGAARLIDGLSHIGARRAPDARLTVGQLVVHPNSRNVVPGSVFLTVDIRHPDAKVLADMDWELRTLVAATAEEGHLSGRVEEVESVAPTVFGADCVALVRAAAEAAGLKHRDMVSGAGHDACHLAKMAPSAMIFVPCTGGLSHNELESATSADLANGCAVLFRVLLERAGRA